MRLMGPHGRFRLQLINRCVKAGKTFDDASVSPVMRQVRGRTVGGDGVAAALPLLTRLALQVLQHWGYELKEEDFKAYAKEKGYDVE
jgi:hypothetical protein